MYTQYMTAAKFSWIKRLLTQTEGKWKKIMWKMINIEPDLLNKNPPKEISNLAMTEFHKQILESWLRINKCREYNEYTILNEYITHNKNIKIKGTMILKDFFKNNNAINLKIWDIINENGCIKVRENLNSELSLTMNQLDYNSLKSSIPIYGRKRFEKKV